MQLAGAPGREAALTEDQAKALKMAEAVANQQDFRLELALAADNYAELDQCLQKVYGAARQFHAAWRITRDKGCLAAAQGLDIRSALLNGLYTIRLLHQPWHSSMPFASPASLAYVLPLFRHALYLCEHRSDAVQFPIKGLQLALEHLHQQVDASLQGLKDGQWHDTAEGRWYAERHATALARGEPDLHSWPALAQSPDGLPPPFDGLADQCQELRLILEQLPDVLAKGPASRQAGQRSFKSALGTGQLAAVSPAVASRKLSPQPRVQEAGKPTQAPIRTTPPRPAAGQAATRTTPPDPVTRKRMPQAPRHVPQRPDGVDPPFHGAAQGAAALSMTETVAPPETAAVKPPTVDAAEAARLRQERIAALQAAVDQFLAEAGRGDATGAAGGTPGTVAEPSWARHAREFDACDAASARAEALAEEARILSGPTGSEPAVESLQEKIEAASCRALAQAASAAQATLAGFAQACNTAIVQGDLEGAGASSYAELAQHCRDRQMQWETASLRLHMPELGLRMELYGAYEAACARMRGDPGRTADALNNTARQLNDTARMVQRISRGAPADLAATLGTFHKFCQHKRNDLLREVSRMQVDAIARIRADAAEALNPVLPRSLAVSAAYDVLLLGNRVGDPLPDDLDGTPDVPSGSASTDPASTDSPQLPTASSDLSLAEMALKVAESARDQHKGVVELPANAPERAAHELQAGLAMLRQTELTAQTAAATIGRFHELSSGLENARPNDRRAIAKRHLDAVRQLAAELRQALQVLDGVTTRSLAPDVHDRLTQSKARLRADQRLAARVEVSLKTLDSLLTWREVADGVRQGIKQGRETNVANDTVAGVRHGNAIKELNGESSMLTRQLPDEPDPVEAESLETHKSGLELLIKCDKELTLGKILLEWGTKVLQHKGRPPNPQGFMSLKHLVAGQPGRLVANNMSLLARSTSSEHAGRYEAQLEINNRTIRGLRELKEKLDNKATPGAAAGSSNSQASVARLLGIPAKGKPSRHSQPRRR